MRSALATPPKADTIRLVIADDHAIFRDGLRRLLEADPQFRVVGEAVNGREAVRLARELKPDVLLLDLAMPGSPGLEALKELAKTPVPVHTLLLAAAAEKHEIVEALQLGARGVVLKQSATELLFKSIRAVMSGEYWVGRERVADLVETIRALALPAGQRQKNFGLTARELEIVSKVVAGYTNRQIAEEFSISEKTVKHHLTNIFDKLGVSNRLELALFALHHGLEPARQP